MPKHSENLQYSTVVISTAFGTTVSKIQQRKREKENRGDLVLVVSFSLNIQRSHSHLRRGSLHHLPRNNYLTERDPSREEMASSPLTIPLEQTAFASHRFHTAPFSLLKPKARSSNFHNHEANLPKSWKLRKYHIPGVCCGTANHDFFTARNEGLH